MYFGGFAINSVNMVMDYFFKLISFRFSLQALHIHNNHLFSLPSDLIALRKLFILVLAFNRFTSIPSVVAQMTDVRISDVENIIMAGNGIDTLPHEIVTKMKYAKKVFIILVYYGNFISDFCHNPVKTPSSGLPPSGKIRENQGKFLPSGKSGNFNIFVQSQGKSGKIIWLR